MRGWLSGRSITAGGRGRACLLLLGGGGLGPASLQQCASMHHRRWAGESLPAAAGTRGAGACLPSRVCRHASPQVGGGRAWLLLLLGGGLGPAFLQECAAMHHLRWAGGELACCCCLEGGWGLPSFNSVPPCITAGRRGRAWLLLLMGGGGLGPPSPGL